MTEPTDPSKPRSYEVTDGYQRAPARAMLRAVGMTDDDWGRSQVGVASSWNEVTPCNMPLDRLAKRAKDGVPPGRRLPHGVLHDRRLRRHLHGPRGHAGVAGEPGADRRLGGVHGARRAARRPRGPGRLRQVAARHADGRRPAQRAQRVPLRRLDPARQPQRHAARHRVACSRRWAPSPPAPSTATSCGPSRRRPAPPRGPAPACSPPTRWPSIGEAHRHVAARLGLRPRRRPPPRRLRPRLGGGGDEAGGGRTSAPGTS